MTDQIKPATPLPWHFEFGEREWVRCSNRSLIFGGHYTGHERPNGGRKPSGHVATDMKYIVHACNAYPKLVEENQRLSDALKKLLIAINSPEVTCKTIANETWYNVLLNAATALAASKGDA